MYEFQKCARIQSYVIDLDGFKRVGNMQESIQFVSLCNNDFTI